MNGLTVLICTAHRPARLQALLRSIADDQTRPTDLQLIVVDNSHDASAAPVLTDCPFPINGVHLLKPNIADARNLALAHVQTDVALFLDDDQLVPPDFFAALDHAWRGRPAWASGLRLGVQPAPEPGADPRFAAAGVTLLPAAHPVTRKEFATNGVLLTSPCVSAPHRHENAWRPIGSLGRAFPPLPRERGGRPSRRLPLTRPAFTALGTAPFDPCFGLTGGEDTEFFVRLSRLGYRLTYRPDVVALERIPAARATVLHLLKTGFRTGMTDAMIACRSEGQSTLDYALDALKHLANGVVLASTSSAIGRSPEPTDVMQVSRFFGKAFALLGGRWEPYRPAHMRGNRRGS